MKLNTTLSRARKSGLLGLSLAVALACGPLAAAEAATEALGTPAAPSSSAPSPGNATPLPLVPPAPPSPAAQPSTGTPSTATPLPTPAVTPPRPVGAPAPAPPSHGNGHVPAAVIEDGADSDSASTPVSADQPQQSVLAAQSQGDSAEPAVSQAVPAPVASPALAAQGGELPFTGLGAIELLVVGAALLAGGVMLRIAKSSE